MRCSENINISIDDFITEIKENHETRDIDEILEDHHRLLIDRIRERNKDFYEYWLKNENA